MGTEKMASSQDFLVIFNVHMYMSDKSNLCINYYIFVFCFMLLLLQKNILSKIFFFFKYEASKTIYQNTIK